MTLMRLLTAVLLILQLAATSAFPQPGNAPATRPAEERAERGLVEQMGKLDAEYRAKNAEILRRYAAQLNVAKKEALAAGERREAQRIFDKIADVNKKIAEPAPPAGKPAMAFSIRISDFNGTAGYTNVVNLSGTDVSITAKNDFGRPEKVVWEAKLTAEQQDRLTKFLRTFPLDRLDDSYVDLNVNDGFQCTFTIQLGDAPPRKITVANRRQFNLERLIDEANELLPPDHLLGRMGR